MALVLFRLQDGEDKTIEVQMFDEPKCYEGQTVFSPAQHLAAIALGAIHAEIEKKKLQDKPKSKLILAGADEMPH